MGTGEILKLQDALFKSSFQAFRVMRQPMDEGDDYREWDLEPLLGPTLARQYVQGPFEGIFIIAAKIVTQAGPILDCYLDIVLPERTCENCYLQDGDGVTRSRGRRVCQGRAVPTIAIEQFGVPQLFFAKENPAFGIEVLQKGLDLAREKKNIAYDLAVLLRDAKRFEEAIEAFSIFLAEDPAPNIAHSIYQQRSFLYDAIGQHDKAKEDKRLWALAFAKIFGRQPTAQETSWN
jgi:tetratricopeptide (TPR) repeat protein